MTSPYTEFSPPEADQLIDSISQRLQATQSPEEKDGILSDLTLITKYLGSLAREE